MIIIIIIIIIIKVTSIDFRGRGLPFVIAFQIQGRHFARGERSGCVKKCWLFSQATFCASLTIKV